MLNRIFLVMSIVASVVAREVCYQNLGCFSDDLPWAGSKQRPISRLPSSPEKINTRFLLYTIDNLNTFQEISAIKPETLNASNFSSSRKTTFIIHGYMDNEENKWLKDMCQEMLQVEDVNCIVVEWHGGSLALSVQASNDIRVVGAEVAYFLKELENLFDYPPSKLHLIGHSLGAHAAGEAGKRYPGIRRITGLDPVQPYFLDTPAEVRLDPSDALFVDAIHTNGSPRNSGSEVSRSSQTTGHLDFFPNGGIEITDCPVTRFLNSSKIADLFRVDLVACNQRRWRSIRYYLDSIRTPDGFLGYAAHSYDSFQKGAGFPCPSSGCPMMGHYAENYSGITSTTHQTFYLNTGDVENFSRWRYKITVNTKSSPTAIGSLAVSLEGSHGKTQEYSIYSGTIRSGTPYTTYIDSEMYVGHIREVTLAWYEDLVSLSLGASNVTVQSGKNGAKYSFCGRASILSGVHQVLNQC